MKIVDPLIEAQLNMPPCAARSLEENIEYGNKVDHDLLQSLSLSGGDEISSQCPPNQYIGPTSYY